MRGRQKKQTPLPRRVGDERPRAQGELTSNNGRKQEARRGGGRRPHRVGRVGRADRGARDVVAAGDDGKRHGHHLGLVEARARDVLFSRHRRVDVDGGGGGGNARRCGRAGRLGEERVRGSDVDAVARREPGSRRRGWRRGRRRRRRGRRDRGRGQSRQRAQAVGALSSRVGGALFCWWWWKCFLLLLFGFFFFFNHELLSKCSFRSLFFSRPTLLVFALFST